MIYAGAMTGSGAVSQVIEGERLNGGEGAHGTHVALAQQYKCNVFSDLLMAERVGFEPNKRLMNQSLA